MCSIAVRFTEFKAFEVQNGASARRLEITFLSKQAIYNAEQKSCLSQIVPKR